MSLTRRKMIQGASALVFLAPMPARAGAATKMLDGPAFGGAWRLVLPIAADAEAARRVVEAVVEAVDAAMSPWRDDSEIARFNRSTVTGWHNISAMTCNVTAEAAEVSRLTGGAFDPTVGPLVARFGFGPITGDFARGDNILCRDDGLRKTDSALTLDLCGIAKGYALDLVGNSLRRLGMRDALIEMGGEVLALGAHPSGRSWQVAIEQPGARAFAVQRIIAPGTLALATSGHAPQGYGGLRGRISHLIDPITQRPALSALASVSVLAPTGARADALATALTVLGPDRGPQLARQINIPALFLIRRDSQIDEIITAGFDRHILA